MMNALFGYNIYSRLFDFIGRPYLVKKTGFLHENLPFVRTMKAVR